MVDTKFVYPMVGAALVLIVAYVALFNFTSPKYTNLYGMFIIGGGLIVLLGLLIYRQMVVTRIR
jgi:hypothetical protein